MLPIFFDSMIELMLPFLFGTHMLIFFCTLYLAIHNRVIPLWLITGLWYIGLSSLITAATIVVEWTLGPNSWWSYSNWGKLAATLGDFIIAVIAWSMFVNTIKRDILESRNRKTTRFDV